VHGGCYQDMCWGDAGPTFVAVHPDGKRAAALDGSGKITIFDIAAKKAVIKFAPLEVTNQPGNLWFAGEGVFIRGNDAGPASVLWAYSLDGKLRASFQGLYHGQAAITSDGRIAINEYALATLTILGPTFPKGTVVTRTVPKGPCKPEDVPEWTDDTIAAGCKAYLDKHYAPYDGAAVIDDGANYSALDTDGTLLQLDGKTLAETKRVKLAKCPKPS